MTYFRLLGLLGTLCAALPHKWGPLLTVNAQPERQPGQFTAQVSPIAMDPARARPRSPRQSDRPKPQAFTYRSDPIDTRIRRSVDCPAPLNKTCRTIHLDDDDDEEEEEVRPIVTPSPKKRKSDRPRLEAFRRLVEYDPDEDVVSAGGHLPENSYRSDPKDSRIGRSDEYPVPFDETCSTIDLDDEDDEEEDEEEDEDDYANMGFQSVGLLDLVSGTSENLESQLRKLDQQSAPSVSFHKSSVHPKSTGSSQFMSKGTRSSRLRSVDEMRRGTGSSTGSCWTEEALHPPAQPALRWTQYSEGAPVFPYPKFASRNIVQYKDFLVCYDNLTRTVCWTLEEVPSRNVEPMRWYPPEDVDEPRIGGDFRSTECDYKSVEDRFRKQHSAEVEYHVDRITEDVKEACVYSNVFAQAVHGKGCAARSLWDELYDYVAELSHCTDNFFILTGALYLPQQRDDCTWAVKYELIGQNKVAVPTHFYKVILCRNKEKWRLECYKFENKPHEDMDLKKYLVPRHDLEKDTGFLIFDGLPDCLISEQREIA